VNEVNTKFQGKGKLPQDMFPDARASEVKLSLLLEHISEQNLSHVLSHKTVFESFASPHLQPQREMSLASINSSKMNFLQACVMLTRGQ
jgi:hypothetical protein